ncbi:cation:proton antiporter [Falsihalocynthiibacter arcticus]|uniref:Sodium:proton antiporter n=1 Tax=Falsihalocynthiibacter arcticus TaxID=1579316 RepID=A0A126V2K2_9RHOB|nr:cation:proton antiporter [Falsihalocynthiibacter arcticus]AML52116.1 sodium:proton antiporter [Falsihalocynthiibacter arcticus]
MDVAIMAPFESFLALGGLFLLGLAADHIGRRTWLPRVTLLLLCGLAFGDAGVGIIPQAITDWSEFLSVTALTMVAFLLGGTLKADTIRASGVAILTISVSIVIATLLLVSLGLWGLGFVLGLALILAAIATATDPAATNDVIAQSGITNRFTNTPKGVVAIDDAWGLIVFSVVLVIASQLNGASTEGELGKIVWEIGGAVGLGIVIGLPGAFMTGRISDGDPLETEALGLVFMAAGLALWLEVSFLIAGMTAGALIVNLAKHHTKAFHEIEHLQWPFMILFFVLAGASLEVDALWALGFLGATYVILRLIARIIGGWIGASLGGLPRAQRPLVGTSLLAQAGVAIGMALVAAQRFPEWGSQIMAITIGTTILFEIIGPIATLLAIRKVTKPANQDS